MKVIGHTSESTVLVEADIEELANLMGLPGAWDVPEVRHGYERPSARGGFPVGREIPISKLWQIIRHERSRPGEITNAVRNLRALADMLETVNATLPTPAVDEGAEKGEAA